jgi:hypothetical protein
MNIYTDISQVTEEPVVDGLLYIYVLENYPQGNIKIGKSSNVKQRFKSLSGSNGGGNKIVRCAVSPVTYLYSLEKTAHCHFHRARIEGTEWFAGDKITFDEVVDFFEEIFKSDSYERANEIRKNFTLEQLSRKSGYTINTEDRKMDDEL